MHNFILKNDYSNAETVRGPLDASGTPKYYNNVMYNAKLHVSHLFAK